MTDDPTDFIRASREICKKLFTSTDKWALIENRGFDIECVGEFGDKVKIARDVCLPDGEAIIAARQALPRALDIIEAQQKQLAEQQAEIERLERRIADLEGMLP